MSETARPYRVAVLGGGWAGCAAAADLAAAGVRVRLYEQAPVLGGRARRVPLQGLALDNGQHLLIGAYRDTLQAIARVARDDAGSLWTRSPLRLQPFGLAPDAVRLAAPRVPAPWHLLLAVLGARGLSLAERHALVRDFRTLARAGFECDAALTVRELFPRTPPRAFAALWAPLCLAALNTPPERASGSVFARVLRAAFADGRAGSDFLLPHRDLSTLFPEPAARYVESRGGHVATGARVLGVHATAAGVEIAASRHSDTFDAAVLAVAPHQLAHVAFSGADTDGVAAAVAAVAAFAYEPITTVYAAYTNAECPPIARLDDAPGQWVFDRGPDASRTARVLGVVISASGPHDLWPQETLVGAIDAQLRRLQPALGILRWSRVIAERRATYACVPQLRRPRAGRIGARLHLAGDYTDPEFPATLEAAVRSGHAAARSVLAERTAAPPRSDLP